MSKTKCVVFREHISHMPSRACPEPGRIRAILPMPISANELAEVVLYIDNLSDEMILVESGEFDIGERTDVDDVCPSCGHLKGRHGLNVCYDCDCIIRYYIDGSVSPPLQGGDG